MPTIDVYNMEGKVCGTLELSDKVFAAQVNGPVIHSVVRAYLLNQRQGTQSTLTRSEVLWEEDIHRVRHRYIPYHYAP